MIWTVAATRAHSADLPSAPAGKQEGLPGVQGALSALPLAGHPGGGMWPSIPVHFSVITFTRRSVPGSQRSR